MSDAGLIKAMAWSGVLLVVSLAASYALMGFLPPPSPDLPAEAIKAIFIERKTEIRIGSAIQSIGYTFYLTWAMAIVLVMRRMEGRMPVLSWTSMANAGGGMVLFLIQPLILKPVESDSPGVLL